MWVLSQLRLPGHTTNARTAKPPRRHGPLTASDFHADTSTLHPHDQRTQETNPPSPSRPAAPGSTGNARLWLPTARPPGGHFDRTSRRPGGASIRRLWTQPGRAVPTRVDSAQIDAVSPKVEQEGIARGNAGFAVPDSVEVSRRSVAIPGRSPRVAEGRTPCPPLTGASSRSRRGFRLRVGRPPKPPRPAGYDTVTTA